MSWLCAMPVLPLRAVAPGICETPAFDVEGLPVCDRPAVTAYTGACVHEHVLGLRKCAEHAAEVRLAERSGLHCPRCCEAGHRCPVTLVWAEVP